MPPPPTKQSKYTLRMLRLSSKIFSEYIRPEMPPELGRNKTVDPMPRQAWHSYHYQNEEMISRLAARPADLEPIRKPDYYPGHPQIKDLMATLREHGLYRYEFCVNEYE